MADSDVKDMLSTWGLESYIDVFKSKTFLILYVTIIYVVVNIIRSWYLFR